MSYNLLIVDDEYYAIKGILEGVKWEALPIGEICTANSAQQARDIVTNHKIDIILCDIEMAQEDGLSFIAWVREQAVWVECIFITCHANFDFAREAIRLQSFDYLLKPVSYERLEELLQKAIDKIRRRSDQRKVLQYGEIYLDHLAAEHEKKENPKKSNGEIVEEVSKYIKFHLAEDLNVEQLANVVYLSPDYLTRIFRKETGKSLIKYMIEERMYMAEKLLKSTQLAVNLVASEVGYQDYAHFTKMFRRTTGLAPSDYRKRYAGAPEGL